MKRLFTLFVLICMAVGIADVAVAQDAPTTKIRYVYLWDVTGSIKPAGKEKPIVDEGLYGRIYGYLRQDVESKPDGTEIIIVPFNDAALTPIKFKVTNGKIVAQSGRQWGELAQYGCDEVGDHYKKWYGNQVKKDPNEGGFTDIAKSLDYVRRNYVDSNYNNIFILLTDGGQEYVADDDIRTKGDAARQRLQGAIEEFDMAMRQQSSTNRLFYVITVEDQHSPHKHQNEMDLQYTHFIDASVGSVNLHFCPISAQLDIKNGVISSRNKSFNIKLSTKEGYELLSGIKLNVEDNVGAQTVEVRNCVATVNCDGRYEVDKEIKEARITLNLSATLPNDGEVERGNDIYHYWFDDMTLSFKVTNNFKPTIDVTTEADCANWGTTEYYSSVPLSEYEPVMMEQVLDFELNPDACKLFDGKGKVEFYASSNKYRFEPLEDIDLYFNGEKCDDYHFVVDFSAVGDDRTNYVTGTLGFQFAEGASESSHNIYIGYDEDLTESVKEYNRSVNIDGVRHTVDLNKDLDITVAEVLASNGIVITKTEVMNPLVKGLMWTLIVLVTIFILSIILSRMMTQKIQVPAVTLVGESGYYKRLTTRGYQKVVLTSKRKKQGFFNKLYKGTILYEVNEVWTSDVTFEPRNTRKKSLHIGYNVGKYTCDASILERSNSYKLTDLATKKKTEITLS